MAPIGMLADAVQHLAEVGELFVGVLFNRPLQILPKRLHAVEASFVQGLQDVQGSK
jgi:hypothetical protein